MDTDRQVASGGLLGSVARALAERCALLYSALIQYPAVSNTHLRARPIQLFVLRAPANTGVTIETDMRYVNSVLVRFIADSILVTGGVMSATSNL